MTSNPVLSFVFSAASAKTTRAAGVAALACLALAGCGGGGPAAVNDYTRVGSITPMKSQFSATYPHDFPIHGIDVSKYQGDIDWQSVRQSGIEFAYIKATEGADKADPKFRQNWADAKAAGLRRGAYHFAYWCRRPEEEMRNFIATVPNDPDSLPPVLDVEATPTSGTCKKTLYREETIAQMRRMLEMMEQAYGKRPVIYSTVDFYQSILEPNELSEYPIWVRSTKYSPHVRYGQRKWHFWQYQSDARVPGIRGNVDRNAFGGDHNQWLAFAGGERGTAMGYAPNAQTMAPMASTPSIPGSIASPMPQGMTTPRSIEALIAAAPPVDPDE